MTSDSWRDVEKAFLAVLDLPESDRPAYLDALDSRVRAEVEGMLRGHAEGDLLLPTPPEEPAPGMRAGPYRLVELIGQGGMGLVYRAERADDQYRKQVAVKLIRSHAFAVAGRDEEALARFRVERQILALLEHPNIVRLLDAGVTEDGSPYFVMELVEGQAITAYCESRQLDRAERLRLFQEVCAAIDYAHRHQVIHRDIKPANILVTGQGEVKVLDFGIAKLLAADAVTTRFVPMTPDYASPEHLQGKAVTTASDIYSLGLVLYELVTGEKARPGPAKPIPQARDLESIFLKASADDAAERYASAAELSRDVGLFLAGSPVGARQATLRYVVGKAVRRNRGKVLAGLAVAIVAGGAVWWEWRQVTLERQRRYEQMRDVARNMIIDMQVRIRDLPGSLEARKNLIQQALGYLESLRKEAGGDSRFDVELGLAYLEMASLQSSNNVSNLGDVQGAKESMDKARTLAESVLARDPGFVPASRLLAASWERASNYRASDAPDFRLSAAQKAFAIRKQLAETHPEDPRNLRDFASAFQFLGFATEDLKRREELFLESLRRIDALLEKNPKDRDLLRNAALGAKYLGGSAESRLQYAEALGHQQRALALDLQLLEADPKGRMVRMDVSIDQCGIGLSQTRLKNLPEAQKAFESCLALRQALVDEEPKDTRARDRLAYGRMMLSGFWRMAGNPDRSLEEAGTAIRVATNLEKEAPSMQGSTMGTLGQAYRFRALALMAKDQRQAGCEDVRRALAKSELVKKQFRGKQIFSKPEADELLAVAAKCGS